MEHARYWMWTRRKFTDPRGGPSFESWEEEAFAQDSSGRLGGCVWPPRSYSCSFCRREFRSAQALGGHMNVHRQDRARLRQSPGSADGGGDHELFPPCSSLLLHHQPQIFPIVRGPNPNNHSHDLEVALAATPKMVSLLPSMESSTPSQILKNLLVVDHKEIKLGREFYKRKRDLDDDAVADHELLMIDSKKPRTESIFPNSITRSSGVQTIDIPSVAEGLDLELRLGERPKVK